MLMLRIALLRWGGCACFFGALWCRVIVARVVICNTLFVKHCLSQHTVNLVCAHVSKCRWECQQFMLCCAAVSKRTAWLCACKHLHVSLLVTCICMFWTGNIVLVRMQASAYCHQCTCGSRLSSALCNCYLCHLDLPFVLATSFVVVCASAVCQSGLRVSVCGSEEHPLCVCARACRSRFIDVRADDLWQIACSSVCKSRLIVAISVGA